METTNRSYYCLDIAKFIFAIFVIAIHTQPSLPEPIGQLQALAVPFFFAVSAFLLFIKLTPPYIQSAEQESNIFSRYCLKMIKIYVAWNIVYLPIAIYEYVLWHTGIIKGFLLYIKDFFCRGGHYYSGQLWFLLSCIYGIILISFFRKKHASPEKILFFGIIALLILCLTDYIAQGTFQTPLFIAIQKFISLTIRDGKLLAGFYYMALSMVVIKYHHKISSLFVWTFFLATFMIYPIANNIQLAAELCMSITVTCLTIGLSRITLSDRKIYRWLRRSSLVMYYSHNLFIFIWIILLKRKPGNNCFLITVFCTLILSCTVNLIYEKTNKNSLAKKLLRLLSL